MIEYEEFNQYKRLEDKNNPFSALFQLDTGERFYIEPVFLTQLHGFRDHYKEKYPIILARLEELVKKNKNVVFVGNYEYPQTEVEGFIYLEITDVTDPLKIYVEDKSRGSDYGE